MGTFNANINPTATGLKLGTTNQRWDVNAQTIDASGNATVSGNQTVSGNLTVTGTTAHTGAVTFSGGIASGATITSPTITSPTITTPTISSPVINGTPSGTGIPTLTQKKGSGGGDYTSTSVTYADVDGTNLAYTVTIPTGWKLAINASFGMFVSTAAVQVLAAISDGGSVLQEITTIPNAIANPIPTSLTALIAGDGASHTIKLQFKTTNVADAVGISNSAGNRAPIMVFNLTPSN